MPRRGGRRRSSTSTPTPTPTPSTSTPSTPTPSTSTPTPPTSTSFSTSTSRATAKKFSEVYQRRREKANTRTQDKWENRLELYNELDERLGLKDARQEKWDSLDDDVKSAKLYMGDAEYVHALVYFSLLLYEYSDEDNGGMLYSYYRHYERIRALLHHSTLESSDLEEISVIARSLCPHKDTGFQHWDFLQSCHENITKWFSDRNLTIIKDRDVKIDTLLAKLRSLRNSSFSKHLLLKSSSCCNGFEYKIEFIGLDQLKNKLEFNALETVRLEGTELTVSRLSPPCRHIIRGIVMQLKNIYGNNASYRGLCLGDVLLQIDTRDTSGQIKILKVKLRLVDGTFSSKLMPGSCHRLCQNFKELTTIIDFIVSVPETQYPVDLKCFVDCLNDPSEKFFEIWNASCLWEPSDVVKNILVFTVLAKTGQYHYTVAFPGEKNIRDKLLERIALSSKYKAVYDTEVDKTKRLNRMTDAEFLLFFMKDSFSHAHEHSDDRTQCILTTEGDLRCLLPEFLPNFVKKTAMNNVTSGMYEYCLSNI